VSPRPDIGAVLEPGEDLLWSGHPRPGRRVPRHALLRAFLMFAATPPLLLVAGYIAIYRGDLLIWNGAVLALVTLAALVTWLGLRITVLDRRRARARDRRTAYAITPRRVLAVTGPYMAEVPLGPGAVFAQVGDTITIASGTDSIRFERLADAAAVRSLLDARTEGMP
jgi:hypothetical protein